MTPLVDVVIVHYHAAGHVAAAVRALLDDGEASAVALRITVVDNGSSESEREVLRALPVDIVESGRNAGYSAAINLAVPRTTAPFVVVMNEDVRVVPGCLGTLLDAILHESADIAGPAFFWDSALQYRLPCTEERGRSAEIRRLRSRRDPAGEAAARRAWREHARRFWNANSNVVTPSLSGALLMFNRKAWECTGGFDEGYFLYYEEDDWLRRAAALGITSTYVPRALAVHLHDVRLTHEKDRREAASFVRFSSRHYGVPFTRRLVFLSGSYHYVPVPCVADWDQLAAAVSTSAAPLWLEVSPSPFGFPAAAHRIANPSVTWSVPCPDDLQLRGIPLRLQLVSDDQRELWSGLSTAGLPLQPV